MKALREAKVQVAEAKDVYFEKVVVADVWVGGGGDVRISWREGEEPPGHPPVKSKS